MRGPTAGRPGEGIAVAVAWLAAIALVAAFHRAPVPVLPPASNQVFGAPTDLCARFEPGGFAAKVDAVDLATISHPGGRGSTPVTVGFLLRVAARGSTPPALRALVRSLAGALDQGARTGVFEEARRVATATDRRMAEACP